jgi:PPK2 family polyphosphate:nucleotide phosphotransferase
MKPEKLLALYRVDDPDRFRLSSFDPDDTGGLDLDKDEAKAMLAEDVKRLGELQERLYAHDRWSFLIVLQAMDAAGKDGVIKHVTTGINPQGCVVHPFKAPSPDELDHDFLWRAAMRLPERGHIGIFNRSHYEEVLVVRVHPELLARQHLPPRLVGKDIWEQRYQDINDFELYLSRNGVLVRKFFLNVSRKEQKKRLLERLDDPDKNWKFDVGDIRERRCWDDYMAAYQDMIRATSSKHAPWFVVPADNKWYTRLVVGAAVIDALQGLDLAYPEVDEAKRKELAKVRKALADE